MSIAAHDDKAVDGPRKTSNTGWVNALRWPLRFLLDKQGNPSTTKVLIFAQVGLTWAGHAMETVSFVAALAASFGYSMWKDYQTRITNTLSGAANFAFSRADTNNTTRTITETVQSRRDPVEGIESTP